MEAYKTYEEGDKQMTEAHKKILKMIEAVDPSDDAGMDDIDELVFRYCGNGCYPAIPLLRRLIYWYSKFPRYTRSRDALKAIRPEGWITYKHGQDMATGVWITVLVNLDYGGKNAKSSGEQLTKELAELHAIIQAIAHERGRE
jgi:hypothetical protein